MSELSRPPKRRRPSMTPAVPAVELRGITKRFGDLVANDAVDFDVLRGEVHALLGENGAGKTTLMNVLYGLLRPDAGEIRVRGEPTTIDSPRRAIELGIGMVHQHFMLVPVFTVAENVVLGLEPRRGPFLDREGARRRVEELSKRLRLGVDADRRIEDISVGQQQRVEILKVLYRGADVLILDEPTAVLTPQETDELFDVIRSLTRDGVSVVLITHKLKEVLAIADRITVLRAGAKVGTLPVQAASEERLASLMVGREVLLRVAKGEGHPGRPLLRVTGLRVADDRGQETVRDVSFDVRSGEIVGIAGVDGNGQAELIEALTGLRRPRAGRIELSGIEMTRARPRRFLEKGVGYIPEDRQRRGLILSFSLAENLALRNYSRPPISHFGLLHPRAMATHATRLIDEFDVRGGEASTAVSSLSGGNQQKVVVARELARDPTVLIAAQPTRGLDVGATEFVHGRLVAERDKGRAILLVSFSLEEILSLSDRILVLYEGRIVGEYLPTASEQELGSAMTGGRSAGRPIRSRGPRPQRGTARLARSRHAARVSALNH